MIEPSTDVIERTLRIDARPETVWRYWTEPGRLCDWWGAEAELDPRPGGVYVVAMGDSGLTMRGEYLELVPHERIVFSFGWDPTPGAPVVPPGSSRVEITLVPDEGATVMTVRHTGLPASEQNDHVAGWDHRLPMFVAAVGARPDDMA